MARPELSADERAQLEAELAKQQNFAQSFQAQIAAQEARVLELEKADNGFKKFFTYYNGIIQAYNDERKALNGTYQASPIVENDIVQCASINGSHRTTPSLPATDIIRISEFDGGNTTTTDANETEEISLQSIPEDILVNGLTSAGSTVSPSTLTETAITPESTTVDVKDTTSDPVFSVGDEVIVDDGTNFAMIRILSIADDGGAPKLITLTFEFIIPQVTTVAIGASLNISFSGFTDLERDDKLATDPTKQKYMEALIADIELHASNRITHLDSQITAIGANDDPDGTATLAAALSDVETSKAFLENYLLTTDISDVGLGSLSTERASRTAEISARVTAIEAAYTGQTENYYDRRYAVANDRANTSRGTLRLKIATSDGASATAGIAASAQDAADAIATLLG